jgi:hypothetical protein
MSYYNNKAAEGYNNESYDMVSERLRFCLGANDRGENEIDSETNHNKGNAEGSDLEEEDRISLDLIRHSTVETT